MFKCLQITCAKYYELRACLKNFTSPSGQLFVVLKTSGNAHTLLYIGLLSNLFVTNTID